MGQIKKEDQNELSIHWLYRRSRNSVVKSLGDDVIATSHMMSTFNMVEVNVYELDSITANPTLKSKAGDQMVCKKLNISWLFGADRKICPSGSLFGITRQSSAKPRDAK